MNWEKLFSKHVSDKRLMSRILKKLLQLNSKKTIQLKQWAKYSIRHFTREDVQMANKRLKRYSTSRVVREILKPQQHTTTNLLEWLN